MRVSILKWRTCHTKSTTAPSRLLLSQQLDGCSTLMNTLIFCTSLRFWRVSCIVSTWMALPSPLASSSRIYGMGIKPLGPSFPPSAPLPLQPPSALSKHQFVKAVHVEVAKEHEGIVVNLIPKALHSMAFCCTTSLMKKLVPIFSDCPLHAAGYSLPNPYKASPVCSRIWVCE